MSLGFYFDMTRCSGCAACMVACQDRLDFICVGFHPRRITRYEVGTYPAVSGFNVSIGCNHCSSPACVANCPTGAMYISEDGTVLHDDDICTVCGTCTLSCPYRAPQLLESESLILKCDACGALRAEGMNPVCVDACAYRALDFGDMDELREKYGSDLVREVSVLPSAETTNPNLLIKPRAAALEDDCQEVTF